MTLEDLRIDTIEGGLLFTQKRAGLWLYFWFFFFFFNSKSIIKRGGTKLE